MASIVSALSSIVANSPQILPTFPPPSPLIPDGGFSPVRLEAGPGPNTLPLPVGTAFDVGLAVHTFLAFPIQASGTAADPQALGSARFIMPAPAIATTA